MLAEDKFMPEMHLTPFKTICLWRFTLNKERVQKIKETRDSWYIYQNDVDKLCFQHGMA